MRLYTGLVAPPALYNNRSQGCSIEIKDTSLIVKSIEPRSPHLRARVEKICRYWRVIPMTSSFQFMFTWWSSVDVDVVASHQDHAEDPNTHLGGIAT